MKLNKKGYMLVEIILASALAFGLAYFILELTLKVKEKDDDLFVETLVATDKTIISNKLMTYAKNGDFSCDKLQINDRTIKYGDELIVIVNKYTTVGTKSCSFDEYNKILVNIPLSVAQMPNKNYDIKFEYLTSSPYCDINVNGTTLNAVYNDGRSDNYGFDQLGNKTISKEINSTGTYNFYVSDIYGNAAICSVIVNNVNSDNTCSDGYTKINDKYCYTKGEIKYEKIK